MCFVQFITLVFVIYLSTVETYRYRFIPNNDEFFKNCPNIPGNNGMHDLMDMSEMTMNYSDDVITMSGNETIVWEGVQPSDRIDIRAELFKFQRGEWQPTIYSNKYNNVCPIQFQKYTIWYDVYTKHIPEEDRVCINNVGRSYHMPQFVVDTTLETAIKIEGRYMGQLTMEAYDTNNVRREKVICFQMDGEIIRV